MNACRWKMIFVSVVVFSLFSLIWGCKANSGVTPFWLIEKDIFYTNDVKLAQEEIPFNIITPDYLPDELKSNSHFLISGPLKNKTPSYVEVNIEYTKDKYVLYIDETNEPINWVSSSEREPTNLVIANKQVLRENGNTFTSSGEVTGWYYYWSQNGLVFSVGVFSLKENEGEIIVESMIQQMNK